MSIWSLLAVIVVAGAIGGAINALMTDNGFTFPKTDTAGNARVWRPGWLANVVVGAAAALVSWGLYGPYANDVLVGTQSTTSAQSFVLTLSSVVGAFLVGIGGSRYLTNQVDKNLLKVAASKAAGADADSGAASAIAIAQPADALQIADDLPVPA
ncbi:MAG TPA: hypothetical protein VIJ50_05065 [Solirubrobacteraceae bacterium]